MRMDGQKQDKPFGKPGKAPTIHNVHVVDASGSMLGGKYNNAIAGINSELSNISNDPNLVNSTVTIIEFSGSIRGKISESYFMAPLKSVDKLFSGRGAGGSTPLYEVAIKTLDRLVEKVDGTDDRVIVTIFTDGGDTDGGYTWTAKMLEEKVAEVQNKHNFTVTFMGTEEDVKTMVNTVHISLNNTLVHNNTAAGVAASYRTRSASLSNYAKSVVEDGITLTEEFFKKSVD